MTSTLPSHLRYRANELADLLRLAVARRDAPLLLLTIRRAAAAKVDLGGVRQDLDAVEDMAWLAVTLTRGALSA